MNKKQRRQLEQLNDLYDRRRYLHETLMVKVQEAGVYFLQIPEEKLDPQSEAFLLRARAMVSACQTCTEIREARSQVEDEIEILERELRKQNVELPQRVRATDLVNRIRSLAGEAVDSPLHDRLLELADQASLLY